MWTRTFALAMLERALKSFAQCLVGLWIGDSAFDLIQVDWRHALGLAAGCRRTVGPDVDRVRPYRRDWVAVVGR
jgi:hypothetical protein